MQGLGTFSLEQSAHLRWLGCGCGVVWGAQGPQKLGAAGGDLQGSNIQSPRVTQPCQLDAPGGGVPSLVN